MLSIIIAAAQNGAIGKDNSLLWNISADLKFFKEITIGKTLIMGRKTFESLPNELPERKHIVVTHNIGWQNYSNQVEISYDLQALLKKYANSTEEVFIIGGAEIFHQALSFCEKIYLTRVMKEFEADTFISDINQNTFQLEEQSAIFVDEISGLSYNRQIWKRRLQLIIFDMDGLMFDTERVSQPSWKEAGEKFGLKLTESFLHGIMGLNRIAISNLFDEMFGKNIFKSVFKMHEELMRKNLKYNGVTPKDGLYEILDFLEDRGIKKVVASSSEPDMIIGNLESAGITNKINEIISGAHVKFGKPHPDIFLKALEVYNCKPENALVLEDSKNGLLASVAAGIKCILIPDLIQPEPEIRQQALLVAKDLFEFKEWLEKTFFLV